MAFNLKSNVLRPCLVVVVYTRLACIRIRTSGGKDSLQTVCGSCALGSSWLGRAYFQSVSFYSDTASALRQANYHFWVP